MSALDFQHRDLAWVTRDPYKGFLDDQEESGTVVTTHSSSTFPHSNVSEFAMATRQKDEVLQQIRTFLRTIPVHFFEAADRYQLIDSFCPPPGACCRWYRDGRRNHSRS